jgi:hypothetical protein
MLYKTHSYLLFIALGVYEIQIHFIKTDKKKFISS